MLSFYYFTSYQPTKIVPTQSLHSKVDEWSTLEHQVLFSELHLDTSLQDHNKVVTLLASAVEKTLG